MNFKKIALVLLFVGVTAGVGYMLFTLFFGPAPEDVVPVDTGETPGPVTGLPEAGEGVPGVEGLPVDAPTGLPVAEPAAIADGGVTQSDPVSTDPVHAPTISPDGTLSYYNQEDGLFYLVGSDGIPRPISNEAFPFASEITWSPASDKAVIEFPDESKVVYDFELQRRTTLPRHWQDFSFDANGDELVAKSLGRETENHWLIMADADGSNARLIEHLGANEDLVTVSVSPDNNVIAFSDTGDAVGFDSQEILLLGQNNENFQALRIEGFNFTPQWSPTGEHILYSTASQEGDYRPTLWFASAKDNTGGNTRTNLGLQTWADKCTFANPSTVYCAVPNDLPEGIGLQRELASGIPDTIHRLDLVTGRSEVVAEPETLTTISSLHVTPDEGLLYFRDEVSGELLTMRLK